MGEARNGSMLALVGASLEDAHEIAEAGGVTVANDNAPGQVVLSGRSTRSTRPRRSPPSATRASSASTSRARSTRPRWSRPPCRSGPRWTRSRSPSRRFPVFSCASAAPFEDVRAELANALTKPVRWRETVIAMHEAGAPSFVEVGPGKVLARMGKRILKGVPFETPAEGLVHA